MLRYLLRFMTMFVLSSGMLRQQLVGHLSSAGAASSRLGGARDIVHTVPNIIWISRIKTQPFHRRSGCNSTCLVFMHILYSVYTMHIWYRNQTCCIRSSRDRLRFNTEILMILGKSFSVCCHSNFAEVQQINLIVVDWLTSSSEIYVFLAVGGSG